MSPMRSRVMLISIACAVLATALAAWYIADDLNAFESAQIVGRSMGIQEAVSGGQEGTWGSNEAEAILVQLDAVDDDDMLLDVSQNASIHILGSVVIPYTEFEVRPGFLKTASEASRILADAGISREDSVVLYGECLPCGGGPSASTYVYWIMSCLGHERVRVLNGTAEDWAASGRDTTEEVNILPSRVYEPAETMDFTASYEYVRSGQAQLVDARIPEEFEYESIPGSINIPYDSVLDGKKLKQPDQLKEIFAELDADRPVVVFTNTGMKATVVWFALEMLDHDAKLYSFQNWRANQENQKAGD